VWKAVILGVGLALFARLALAQNPPAAPPPKIPEKDLCAVTGLVVRVGTNEPLKRANVSLRRMDSTEGADNYGAQTDVSGRFAVEGIQPGRYNLRISRTGYVTQSYGQESGADDGSGAVLALDPGRKMDGLLFRMSPWSVIAGRITNEDGEPLVWVRVQALLSQFREGRRTLMPAANTQTNDLGDYRLFGLSKGHYYVRAIYLDRQFGSAQAGRPRGKAQSPQSNYAPIFYPGTPEMARAVAMEVRAGQEIPSVDFVMIPTPAVRVRGHVSDALSLKLPSQITVVLRPAEGFGFSPQGNQAPVERTKGTFEIDGVVPGLYEVVAVAWDEKREHSARRRIEVGNSDLEDIDLSITRGVDLHGRLTLEGNLAPDLSAFAITLATPDFDFYGGASAQVKPDGTFTLTEVSEETYQVNVFGRMKGWYLKSVVQNGQDALRNGLSVSPGGSRGLLEVTLSTAGALLDGVVTDDDGLPVPGATVALVPEGQGRKLYSFYRDASTDQNGRFIFRDVRPGAYKLYSWRDVERNAWQDPDVLKLIEDKGVMVSADENAHLTVELKVLPTTAPATPPQ
jgi:protocatechuate 3,4-dioxygenase beta subunit